MVFTLVRRHFVDVFALHPCVGMAGPASEKLTNVGLMRRISIASGNNVGYEKRKHIDESDLNPIFISSDSVNPAICIRSE